MKINEKTGLYENYGMWHVPFWQTSTFKIIMEVVGCVAVLVLLVYLVRMYIRYKKRKKLPAWEQALTDLRVLKIEQKVHPAQGKEFYAAVSEVIKRYLAARFAYDVLGKTDAEVVNYLQEIQADESIVNDIKAIVQGAEIIKFANAQAAQEQINTDYDRITSIITRTIPVKS
jgi:hypothetical protein